MTSIYYPASRSSTNPLETLQNGTRPSIVPDSDLLFINPNTSYYAINRVWISSCGSSYPFTTQIQQLQPDHPDGLPCSISPSFGLTKESISITDGGSDHFVGDIYYIFNSNEDNDPAILKVTQVDEDGAILDFYIDFPGTGFTNSGIVISHKFQTTFAATFSFITNKFCISKCFVTDGGSGFALFNQSGTPLTERKLITTNYGSGSGFNAVALTTRQYDENNNIIIPEKTHFSNPSILSINNQSAFKFDMVSQSWKIANDQPPAEKPICSPETLYWSAAGGAGASATLYWLFREKGIATNYFNNLREDEIAELEAKLMKKINSEKYLIKIIDDFIQIEVSKGLVGSGSDSITSIIRKLLEQGSDPPIFGANGKPIRRWPRPYEAPTSVIINGVEVIIEENVLIPGQQPDDSIIEALRKHRENIANKEKIICNGFNNDIQRHANQLVEQLKNNPKSKNLFTDFGIAEVDDFIDSRMRVFEQNLYNELDLWIREQFIEGIDQKDVAIFRKAIEYVCNKIRRQSKIILTNFQYKTVETIAKEITKKRNKTITEILGLKKNVRCSPKRGTKGKGAIYSAIFLALGLSQAYADSETNEELVNNVTDILLSEFQLIPEGCEEVDVPTPEKSLTNLVEQIKYLLKKYYLGDISQQELIDGFNDTLGAELQKFGSDPNTLLLNPQIQQLIQLIEEEDLKQLADDIANETEWPGDFTFPWNLDREVIKQRTERKKMIEFSIFLKSQMIDKFAEFPCDDLCGSGSNQESGTLQEFIQSDPELTDQDVLGLILQLRLDEENAVDNSLNKYFK